MDRDRICTYLPDTYRAAVPASPPLAAILGVMEAMHAPAEAALDGLDGYFDPARCPDPFVFMLAEWMDLDRYLDWSGDRPGAGTPRFAAGAGRLRLLLSEASELLRWRGTRHALIRFLSVATGLDGFIVDETPNDPDGLPRPFHIRVLAPPGASRFAGLIVRIVDQERPAYATYEVAFASTPPADPRERLHG